MRRSVFFEKQRYQVPLPSNSPTSHRQCVQRDGTQVAFRTSGLWASGGKQGLKALLVIAKNPFEKVLGDARKLSMPMHHDVRAKEVDLARLGAVLAVAHEKDLRDFASLLLVKGLGPRTLTISCSHCRSRTWCPQPFLRSGTLHIRTWWQGWHLFPVPLKIYDDSLAVLRRCLEAAQLGHTENLRTSGD